MSDFIQVVFLSILSAAGNFLGSSIAEVVTISRRRLGLALHAAAGIVMVVVAVELMPTVLEGEPAWAVVAAFVLGGGLFMLVDSLVDVAYARRGKSIGGSGSPWLIYFAVAIDLFTDGLLIGTGRTISFGLALLLALGQVSADIPEGFATLAGFKNKDFPRSTRLLIAASFVIPVLLGATLGYWLVRGQPEIFKLSLLAFAAAAKHQAVVILEANALAEISLPFICQLISFSKLRKLSGLGIPLGFPPTFGKHLFHVTISVGYVQRNLIVGNNILKTLLTTGGLPAIDCQSPVEYSFAWAIKWANKR